MGPPTLASHWVFVNGSNPILNCGAFENFQKALCLNPIWSEPLNDAAQILATHSDPKIKNVDQAIRLAEHVIHLTRHHDISVLETLSMCYTVAG